MSDTSMHTGAFWHATAERAVSTMAESALGALLLVGTGLIDTPWRAILSTAGMAGVLAVLKALAANQVGSSGPSLTSVESLADRSVAQNLR